MAPSKQESTTYEPSLVCKLLILGCRLLIPDRLLAANGQEAQYIEEMFTMPDTTDFAGSVHCAAVGTGMFTALALEHDIGNRILTTLPVFRVRFAGGRAAELDFAHFANGDGITSDLVFVNLSTERSRPAPTPFIRTSFRSGPPFISTTPMARSCPPNRW